MKTKVSFFATAILGLTLYTNPSAHGAEETYYNPRQASSTNFAEERSQVTALFDHPLRDTFIFAGPDNKYYLTGTASADGHDFHNNDGVWLWQSSDLESWEPLGQVWSIERDGTPWQKEYRVNPEDAYAAPVRGMTSNKIHFVKGNWYIPYAMNGQGLGLLRSKSGKPEGPYEDLGRISPNHGAPSLFEDTDGKIYWVYGAGWIARMNDDLSGLAEEPVLLQPKANGLWPGHAGDKQIRHFPSTVGQDGAVITRVDDTYFLTAAAVKSRLGHGNYETMVARADSVKGPYSQRRLMIPHGGQANLFQTHDGKLMASFAGRDRKAALRDRPAVVPLRMIDTTLYGNPNNDRFIYPRIDPSVSVEDGPWARIRPLVPTTIRDIMAIVAPDGNYYMTGSLMGTDSVDRLVVYRSSDLFNWEVVDTGVTWMDLPSFDAANAEFRRTDPRFQNNMYNWMDCEIHWVGDTLWYMGNLYNHTDRKTKKQWPGASFVFASKSGKAEGPWEYLFEARSQPSIFTNDGGKTYLINNHGISLLNPDLSGPSTTRLKITSAQGLALNRGDAPATNIIKLKSPTGKTRYMLFNCNWNGMWHDRADDGTYDWAYYWAENLEGPYRRNRKSLPIPHAGHGSPPLLAADGHWYTVFFGNDFTGPWWCKPGLLRLKLRWDGDEPAFEIDEDWVPGPVS